VIQVLVLYKVLAMVPNVSSGGPKGLRSPTLGDTDWPGPTHGEY